MSSEIDDFIAKVTPVKRRRDAETLLALFSRATGLEPELRGTIIGYGEYHYRYDSGREGIAPEIAFASGATHTLYLVEGFAERWPDLLDRLGPHRTSTACLYLTRLSAVDRDVLREILERSLATVRDGREAER